MLKILKILFEPSILQTGATMKNIKTFPLPFQVRTIKTHNSLKHDFFCILFSFSFKFLQESHVSVGLD